MGVQTEERVIDGAAYAVAQFPATQGLKLFTRLSKLVGPAFASLAAQDGEAAAPTEALGLAVRTLTERLDESTVESTIKELLSATTVDGRRIAFDLDFAGRLGLLFKVLAFVLEVNYRDFLAMLPAHGLAGAAANPK